MADVKFTVVYEVNENAPIPSPKATLTMKIKADENGDVPVNVRCMDRMLGEPAVRNWGSPHHTHGWRTKEIPIGSESWPAVTARVEENILGALARMQEADARYQKLVAEHPADYVYETSVPGPAAPPKTLWPDRPKDDLPEKEDEDGSDGQEWAMHTFGLSAFPCKSAADFLVDRSDQIIRYAESKYGLWLHIPRRMRFQAGIEWLEEHCEADDDDGEPYPIAEWIEWAQNHRA